MDRPTLFLDDTIICVQSENSNPIHLQQLRVNSERLKADFDSLAQIGATDEGGVNRPAFSEEHMAARMWLRERILSGGFEFRMDGAGNHSAYLRCGPDQAPALLLGSHLDSVPMGGKFDGALGVLAALESLRVIKENKLTLPVNLEAINFTDEEGTYIGLMGSSAVVGKLPVEMLQNPRRGRRELLAAFLRSGISEESVLNAAREPNSLAGYIELHIEQGSRLVDAGVDIGIVSAIVGISSYNLTFIGRSDHAGTTPMSDRLDAAQGASAFTLAVREMVLAKFPQCVANVGNMRFAPGAFNIVPEQVEVSLELRAAGQSSFEKLELALIDRAHQEASRFGLELKIEHLGRHSPTLLSVEVQKAITQATETLGLSTMPLISGAGHDAQSMAAACPAGMLFVPSVNGASHSARELTSWNDCINGANVLLQACLNFSHHL
jgi:beta-ureidopropionase / N-carbamoyl-L-amino-acid hydrolase